jgi:hypothetical protein
LKASLIPFPESEQIEFEKKVSRVFTKKVKTREQIMEQFEEMEKIDYYSGKG